MIRFLNSILRCLHGALSVVFIIAFSTHGFAQPPDPEMPGDFNRAPLVQSQAAMTFAMTPELLADSLALVDLYDSAGGIGWIQSTNWKTGSLSTWGGVIVSAGRVTQILLSANHLVGKLPVSLCNLKKMTVLNLSLNQLSGPIPKNIGNLTALTTLRLEDNLLTGPIPGSVGQMVNLTLFSVYRNKLSGELPGASLAKLTKLQYMVFHVNDLSGNLEWIANMRGMLQLYFYGNPNLDCTIPASIGNLVNMTRLIGGGRLATGAQHQKMKGEIPAALGNCTKLIWIYLDNSEFTGPLPSTFNKLKALRIISLTNTRGLSGDLTTLISGFNKLEELSISGTNISGALPDNVITTAMTTLYLGRTRVSGNLPVSLVNATNLQNLSLDSLGLTSVPDWSAKFPNLAYLNLADNQLDTLAAYENHPNKTALQIYVQRNRLDFLDLENRFDASGAHPFRSFEYAPQALSRPVSSGLTVQYQGNLEIKAPAGGQYGVYTWEKLYNNRWIDVDSVNTSSVANFFRVTRVTKLNMGSYRYTVANTRATVLTFHSGIISVKMTSGTIELFPIDKKTGAFCGQDTVVLQDSQRGIVYQLKRDNSDVGSIIPGTSLPLNWTGLTASGVYTVLAKDTLTGFETLLPDTVEITCGYDSLALNSLGIGGPVPDGYSLAVAGKAIATGLNLKIARLWPDYVFQPGYDLRSLTAVEDFIKMYGHLPGLPSAAQMSRDVNYSVSAMDHKLLEKIEELTLYLLSLKKNLYTADTTNINDGAAAFSRLPVSGSNVTPSFSSDSSQIISPEVSISTAHLDNIYVHKSVSVSLSGPIPAGYHLAVGGNIIATGLDLKAPANWPDYVFQEAYQLPSLKELQDFINRNKHLPNIPSSLEMSANQVYSLAEMDVKLLEKIEELTLYIIQLNHVCAKGRKKIMVPDSFNAVSIGAGTFDSLHRQTSEHTAVHKSMVTPQPTTDAISDDFENVEVRKALSISSSRPVPRNYKLAVSGSIVAAVMDIRAPSKWPDYVFGANYPLPTLDELEAYILQYGHLPNLPSAHDMMERGNYSTTEMDAKILEKIEELTLYVLALDAGVGSK